MTGTIRPLAAPLLPCAAEASSAMESVGGYWSACVSWYLVKSMSAYLLCKSWTRARRLSASLRWRFARGAADSIEPTTVCVASVSLSMLDPTMRSINFFEGVCEVQYVLQSQASCTLHAGNEQSYTPRALSKVCCAVRLAKQSKLYALYIVRCICCTA